MRLSGKTAIITGAGSGIGKATALRFAEEGAVVVCAGLSKEDNEATVREIEKIGSTAYAIKTDVTSDDDIGELISQSISILKKVDVLINNAGQAVIGTVEEARHRLEKLFNN